MPSEQLTEYLQLRADGETVERAAELSTIGLTEARLWERDIESGEVELPRARARAREGTEETGMVNGTVAGDELRLLIERIERLKEEIKGINDDVSDVYQEAKSRGFDTATMKRIVKLRKMEPHALQEADALLGAYMSALGMGDVGQPLGLAA